MLARGIGDWIVRPVKIARMLPGTATRAVKLVTERRSRGIGMPAPFTAPRTSFNATLTAHRTVAFTSIDMADIKTIKNHFGVKVNDVVMAACSGGLRRYLDKRGELPEKSLIASVPISVHAETTDRPGINKVSAMFTSLASDIADPVERMRIIGDTNAAAKEDHKMLGATTLQDWAEHAAPNTFALAARLYSSMRIANRHPVVHNVIISNVPGPPIDLYCAGGRIMKLFPLGPLLDGAGLNITALSQQDQLGFGLIACRELMPDIWDLADAITAEVADMVALTKA
jgi:WS/DGAT/MGAT family acyltransferase